MEILIKSIITILIPTIMQISAINMVSTTPMEATEDFMTGIKAQSAQTLDKYMDNSYINFLCNIEGDEEVIKRMNDALFRNFSYEIIDIKQKDDVAVAKVKIASNNFDNVMKGYSKKSYDYVMKNLYDDDIEDKDKLNAKCLEIYVNEIETVAEKDELVENIVYVPMVDDGYYGWNIIMTDEFMKAVLGNLQMPKAS